MTYVVTEACIKCKYTDCVEVCPVDCFYEGDNMLVIHPDECIDCGVCEPECPADAIKPDTEPGLEKWLEVNTEYAKSWPNITQKEGISGSTPRISRAWKVSSRNIFLQPQGRATNLMLHARVAKPSDWCGIASGGLTLMPVIGPNGGARPR